MIIADFDYDQRIEKLKKDIAQVKQIKDSFSESRVQYREFAEAIGVDFDALDNCQQSFEKAILIDAYTIAEQLIKNSYYFLFEIGENNPYISKFVEKKLPKDKFSPNVSFKIIKSTIPNELIRNFKFYIKPNADVIKSYDILITERHTYAHSGNYQFSFERIDDVVKAIEYLYKELESVFAYDAEYRQNLQQEIENIKALMDICKNITDDYKPHSKRSREILNEKYDVLRSSILGFLSNHADIKNLSVCTEICEKIDWFCKEHSSNAKRIKAFKDMNQAINDLFF